MRRAGRLAIVAGTVGLLAAGPAGAIAHSLSVTYQSRLPLVVYLAGAGLTVALSFAFLLIADVRAELPSTRDPGRLPRASIRYGLKAVGLIGWLWIVAQGIAGGNSTGDVTTLFLWVYGWVGLALVSALGGPIWHWLSPFANLFDIGAGVMRRLGVSSWDAAEYPSWLGRWPAIVGLIFFIWLELVGQAGPNLLLVVLVGYTAFSLAMMAQFGRDTWRANGETFSVWLGLLGRLAPLTLVDQAGRLRRRPFASGLLEGGWSTTDIVLIALGTGSILFDGLSQTTPWFSVFGAPGTLDKTLQLAGFLGLIVAAALAVSRLVGIAATGAGLLPIAIGYLIAHYFTYLLIDGQRIVVAISDPLQQGANLFGTAFYEPSSAFLPPGLVWTIQLAAVVGGHMLGAWGGHVVAAREAERAAGGASVAADPRDAIGGRAVPGRPATSHRRREVPLAVIMVALTTLTLWSLGQSLVVAQPTASATAAATATGPTRVATPWSSESGSSETGSSESERCANHL
jgi:hypothetical protein